MEEIDPRQQGNMFRPKRKRDWGMLFVFILSLVFLITGPIFIVFNLLAPGIFISVSGLILVLLSLIVFYLDVRNTKQPVILMSSLFFIGLSMGISGLFIGIFNDWSPLCILIMIYSLISILLGFFVLILYTSK